VIRQIIKYGRHLGKLKEMSMQNDVLRHHLLRAPRFPFEMLRAPKLKILPDLRDDCLIKSLLSHVSHACHTQCHMQIHNDYAAVTCVTRENQPIAHARARIYFFSINTIHSFRNILIILKSACSTCDRSEMIDVSHVTPACDSPFHV
jgi:hypothetical protein